MKNVSPVDEATDVASRDSTFSASLPGTVPSPGAATATYLRADGSWATPPIAFPNAIAFQVISAQQDNWTPTGYVASTTWVQASPTVDVVITGLTGGVAGRVVLLQNSGSTTSITLRHDLTSTSTNRFMCPNINDYVIKPRGSVLLMYDNNRWNIMADGGISAGEAIGTTLSSNVNDWSPSGFGPYVRTLFIAASSTFTITGIAGGFNGREVTLSFGPATADTIIANASASSTAANKIFTHTGADLVCPPLSSVRLGWRSNAIGWYVLATTFATVAGGSGLGEAAVRRRVWFYS